MSGKPKIVSSFSMAINEPGDAIAGSSTVLAAFGRGLDGGGWYHERQPPRHFLKAVDYARTRGHARPCRRALTR
jgi:hypothetical protein